jgi:DNA polymerase III subunit epsilon
LRGSELLIHNADFDVGFLEHELRLMQHPQPAITEHACVLDTLALARKLHPGQRNSLDALCKRYFVDASKREVHGALIDAELLARVYLAMTGGQTVLSLDEESTSDASDDDKALQRNRPSGLRLKVIAANEEENAAHEALLERMRDSGACRWRDT